MIVHYTQLLDFKLKLFYFLGSIVLINIKLNPISLKLYLENLTNYVK